MKTVTVLWRSFEGGDWELVRLYENRPAGEGGLRRFDATKAISEDIGKWTLPIQYKITVEFVEP